MSIITKEYGLASGEVIPTTIEKHTSFIPDNISLEDITSYLKQNYTFSTFRINVLFPDETIKFSIPIEDIQTGGSYQENYQNGQRRSLSFTLYNTSGQYTPNINNFWIGTRLSLELGLSLPDDSIIWVQKGVYVIEQITPSQSSSLKTVKINAADKFSLFEQGAGKIISTYTIPVGTDIYSIIRDILYIDIGNGQVLDSRPLLYDKSFSGKKTQATITKNAGETLGSILLDLATQLNAEIFYNAKGMLTITEINTITQDNNKPLLFKFDSQLGDISDLQFNLDYNQIVNHIVVTGSNYLGYTVIGEALNDYPTSPYSYKRIGKRTGDLIQDSNITTSYLAKERADYELRQRLINKTTSNAMIVYNPLLEVNNLISISDPFFGFRDERFLIQSISCNLDYTNQMSISFSNLKNFSFLQ